MNKGYKIIYLILFVFPIFLFLFIPIRGQNKKSQIESRTLATMPSFSLSDFLKGDYQDNLEQAISDQLILSRKIKVYNKKAENLLTEALVGQLLKFADKCNLYLEVSEGYYNYGCSNYLIEKPFETYDLKQVSDLFNSINVEKYVYFIENSRSIKFNSNQKVDLFKLIKDNIQADGYEKFDIDSFDAYKRYFYPTDHHWNYLGSYKGYTQIINMLSPGSRVLKPIGQTTYDAIFYGSADRISQTSYSNQKFTVYNFEDLNYITYVDGIKRQYYYGRRNYLNNTLINEKYLNHYGEYYGYDFGEVIFDYNQPEKENLLVICTSYSNAIKELLASHFNRTYYVDLRHYENFDVNKYIEENSIDKVLIMGDIYSLGGGDQ